MSTDATAELEPVVGKLLAPPKPSLCVGWNLIADFYKGGHHALLNPKLEYIYHYLESRGGEFDRVGCAGASFVAKVFAEYTLTAAHIDEAIARRVEQGNAPPPQHSQHLQPQPRRHAAWYQTRREPD